MFLSDPDVSGISNQFQLIAKLTAARKKEKEKEKKMNK